MFARILHILKRQWVLPLASVLLACIILLLDYFLYFVPTWLIDYVLGGLFISSLLLMPIFGVHELTKKQWKKGLSRIIFGLGGVLILLFFITRMCVTATMFIYTEDHFADWLEIPKNIKLEEPIRYNEEMIQEIGEAPEKPAIQLYQVGELGVYQAVIWTKPTETGKLYLKAFEITHEYQLSEDELAKEANFNISQLLSTAGLDFFKTNRFLIYEGDWGKPYAARFEVWFRPDSGAPEKKLLEKNFKIEGWQR